MIKKIGLRDEPADRLSSLVGGGGVPSTSSIADSDGDGEGDGEDDGEGDGEDDGDDEGEGDGEIGSGVGISGESTRWVGGLKMKEKESA